MVSPCDREARWAQEWRGLQRRGGALSSEDRGPAGSVGSLPRRVDRNRWLELFFAVFTDTWDELNLSEIVSFTGEAGVAVSMRMQAKSRSTGKPLDTRVGQFLIFEDGLIREFTVLYIDPFEVKAVTVPSST